MNSLTHRDRNADLLKLADAFFENLERGRGEYGGWGQDDKRPFGNSDTDYDIAEIIGLTLPDYDTEYDSYIVHTDYCRELYSNLGDFLKTTWKQLRAPSPITNGGGEA